MCIRDRAYTDSDGVHDYEFYRNLSPQLKVNYKQGNWLSVEGSVLYMNTNFNYAELRESYAQDSPETPWWAFQLPDPNQYLSLIHIFLILFLFILLLEDSGYMTRAAFLMDRLMSAVGLNGRAFIPLLSSFACAIPGIMAARTISCLLYTSRCV